ncbi:hypothetical protein JCM3766R1_000090 [Sporobolomyces carnicolor]
MPDPNFLSAPVRQVPVRLTAQELVDLIPNITCNPHALLQAFVADQEPPARADAIQQVLMEVKARHESLQSVIDQLLIFCHDQMHNLRLGTGRKAYRKAYNAAETLSQQLFCANHHSTNTIRQMNRLKSMTLASLGIDSFAGLAFDRMQRWESVDLLKALKKASDSIDLETFSKVINQCDRKSRSLVRHHR